MDTYDYIVVGGGSAGCTVTSHCGPKTLGVLFLRK